MQELIESVKKIVDEELQRANAVNGDKFHSNHEGYAVIKEELEEASKELREASSNLEDLWYGVKNNESEITYYAEQLKKRAILLAAETIQTAAMATKFIESFK